MVRFVRTRCLRSCWSHHLLALPLLVLISAANADVCRQDITNRVARVGATEAGDDAAVQQRKGSLDCRQQASTRVPRAVGTPLATHQITHSLASLTHSHHSYNSHHSAARIPPCSDPARDFLAPRLLCHAVRSLHHRVLLLAAATRLERLRRASAALTRRTLDSAPTCKKPALRAVRWSRS